MSQTTGLTDTSNDAVAAAPGEAAEYEPTRRRRPNKLLNASMSLKAILVGVVLVALVIALVVVVLQLNARNNDLDSRIAADEALGTAEQVALDYAKGAAEMDFRDLAAWRSKLTDRTSEELTTRLTQAATSMEQIITPLQWTSTAQPIAASASVDANGIYQVDSFVSVLTTNSQAPEGIESTATYRLSIDKDQDWQIVDISGLDSAINGGGK